MSIKEEIKYRKDKEREAIKLAKAYADEGNYRFAAQCYNDADVHRSIWQGLQSR